MRKEGGGGSPTIAAPSGSAPYQAASRNARRVCGIVGSGWDFLGQTELGPGLGPGWA